MAYIYVVASLVALLVCLAALGVLMGYNVELTFHPPIFFKVKLSTTRQR